MDFFFDLGKAPFFHWGLQPSDPTKFPAPSAPYLRKNLKIRPKTKKHPGFGALYFGPGVKTGGLRGRTSLRLGMGVGGPGCSVGTVALFVVLPEAHCPRWQFLWLDCCSAPCLANARPLAVPQDVHIPFTLAWNVYGLWRGSGGVPIGNGNSSRTTLVRRHGCCVVCFRAVFNRQVL